MADPVVSITNGVPTSGTGTITTLGQTLVDGANATLGVTTGTAVTTNASGTLQQYLRGIVSLLVSGITVASHAVTNAGTFAVQVTSTVTTAVTQSGSWVLSAGSAIIGKVGIDQTTDLTTNKVRAFIHDGTTALPILAASSGAPAASSPALPVSIRDVNANGQTTMSASAPVVLPSDTNGPYSATANFVSGAITTAMTGTTSTSLLAAPGAGLRNYITTFVVSNAHATVGTDVIIQDGSVGTTLMTIPAAAVYGGAVITLPTPLKQPTTNTALFCANVTTGASTKVSAFGYKGA
jgi:hypothetical protein